MPRLQTFENGAVTLDGEVSAALVPANRIRKETVAGTSADRAGTYSAGICSSSSIGRGLRLHLRGGEQKYGHHDASHARELCCLGPLVKQEDSQQHRDHRVDVGIGSDLGHRHVLNEVDEAGVAQQRAAGDELSLRPDRCGVQVKLGPLAQRRSQQRC